MPTAIREELRAELQADDLRSRPKSNCLTCAWLRSLPEEEQAAWREFLRDESISNSQLVRAIIERRKAGMSETALLNHRRRGHP